MGVLIFIFLHQVVESPTGGVFLDHLDLVVSEVNKCSFGEEARNIGVDERLVDAVLAVLLLLLILIFNQL